MSAQVTGLRAHLLDAATTAAKGAATTAKDANHHESAGWSVAAKAALEAAALVPADEGSPDAFELDEVLARHEKFIVDLHDYFAGAGTEGAARVADRIGKYIDEAEISAPDYRADPLAKPEPQP